ncbi:Alpha/Beta hydrolase protein [Aspergillus crustosus]
MAYSQFVLLALLTLLPYTSTRPLHDLQPIARCASSDAVRFRGTTAHNVESFLNICFGEDTSGVNRFTPPKPFSYPAGALVNATQPGAACPQPKQAVPTMPLFDVVTSMSEDCLTLRVDRPANTPASAKLPVMVWIYGGGDSFGQIYDSAYDPPSLVLGAAEKGLPIIYVDMNYRVGVFGFVTSHILNASDSLNVGLLDQRLAMGWVRDHIAAFGGDPDNVTLFDESDGATGAGLQVTPFGGQREAPFKRVIMQSGSPMGDPGTASTKSAEHTEQLIKLVFYTSSTSEAELACLRSIPMAKLNTVAVAYQNKVGGDSGMDVFIPDDGSFSTLATLSSGEDVFAYLKSEYPAFSNRTIERAMTLYPVSSFAALPAEGISAHYLRTSRMKRDAEFSCPTLYTAQMNHRDIPYVFNQASAEGYEPYVTPEDLIVSSDISGSWAAFAKSERPSNGSGTVSGWVDAFDSSTASASKDEYILQVIGGPKNGTRATSNGQSGYEELVARCAFWTSEEVLAGLGV